MWLILPRVRYIVDLYYMVWQLCGWYCLVLVILLIFINWFERCVVGIAGFRLYCSSLLFWFDMCVVGIAGLWLYCCPLLFALRDACFGIVEGSLYCVPLLFGLRGAWLILLVVCYILYRYYLV